MAASSGRNLTFTWGAGAILGVREKGLSLNGDPLDITSNEDAGKRMLIDDVSAQDELELSISGVSKDLVLRADWFAGTRTKEIVVSWPDGATLTGDFFLSNYSEAGPYQDAITFDATLVSAGTWVYSP